MPLKRLTKRKQRKQRKQRIERMQRTQKKQRKTQNGGAAKYNFDVILFSKTPVAEDTKAAVLDVLQDLFGSVQMSMADPPLFYYEFEGVTGINTNLQDERSEVLYSIENAPDVCKDKSLHIDKRLTILEGQIGKALLKSGIDVSLIRGSHGIRPEVNSPNNYFRIGLCNPACTKYDNNMFNAYINRYG